MARPSSFGDGPPVGRILPGTLLLPRRQGSPAAISSFRAASALATPSGPSSWTSTIAGSRPQANCGMRSSRLGGRHEQLRPAHGAPDHHRARRRRHPHRHRPRADPRRLAPARIARGPTSSRSPAGTASAGDGSASAGPTAATAAGRANVGMQLLPDVRPNSSPDRQRDLEAAKALVAEIERERSSRRSKGEG